MNPRNKVDKYPVYAFKQETTSMSYLIRFSYFLLVIALAWAGLKWATADFGLREEWHSELSATPPSGFSYAYLPHAPEVLQHIGKTRVVLVTQQELESELVGAYGTDGKILKFPLSSFTPLDANQYDQSLVDVAADVYKKWNDDKYPYSMKLSFDKGTATFTHRSRDIRYESRYQVESPFVSQLFTKACSLCICTCVSSHDRLRSFGPPHRRSRHS